MLPLTPPEEYELVTFQNQYFNSGMVIKTRNTRKNSAVSLLLSPGCLDGASLVEKSPTPAYLDSFFHRSLQPFFREQPVVAAR
jgi:hypothetical protein